MTANAEAVRESLLSQSARATVEGPATACVGDIVEFTVTITTANRRAIELQTTVIGGQILDAKGPPLKSRSVGGIDRTDFRDFLRQELIGQPDSGSKFTYRVLATKPGTLTFTTRSAQTIPEQDDPLDTTVRELFEETHTTVVTDCGGGNDGSANTQLLSKDETTETAGGTTGQDTVTITASTLAALGDKLFAFIGGANYDDLLTLNQHGNSTRSGNAGDPVQIDVAFDGRNRPNGNILTLHGSADARFVVFSSRASNLVRGLTDTAGAADTSADIFLRDLLTGTTALISRHADGVRATGRGVSGQGNLNPRVSGDGRFIVWEGRDVFGLTGTADSTTGSETDVFWHDRFTGETRLVSKNAAGTASGKGSSGIPQVSDDGRYVAFLSTATDLIGGLTTNSDQLFLHDTTTGQTKLITVNAAGTALAAPDFTTPQFNLATGSGHVVFTYSATDLVAGFVNNNSVDDDVYVYDPVTGLNSLVSGVNATTSSNGGYDTSLPVPRISDDGRIVAFVLEGNNLPGATDTFAPNRHIYVRDRLTGALEIIDARPDNKQALAGVGTNPFDLSGDGRYVAFFASDPALLAGFPDGNNASTPDLFVRDRTARVTTVMNVNAAGTSTSQAGLTTTTVRFSGDGRELAFVYAGTDLVTIPDTNADNDIFVGSRHVRFDFAAPAGTDLTLRRNGANYELINTATKAVLAARNAVATQTIRVDNLDGTLTVDFTGGKIVLDEGLTVDGKGGGTAKIVALGGDFTLAEHFLDTATGGISAYDGLRIGYTDVAHLADTAKAANRIIGDSSGRNRAVSVTGTGGVVSVTGPDFVPLSFADPAAALALFLGDGNDTVTVGNLDASYATAALSVYGEGGDDALNAAAATHRVALLGGNGDDTLIGGSGDDRLFDGGGDDILAAGPGDDTYTLTPGSDDGVNDTSGIDTLDFRFSASPIVIDLGAAMKQTITPSGDTLHVTGVFENFIGSNFNDVIALKASAVARSVNGGPETSGLAPGDRLIVNTTGQPATDAGGAIQTAGLADITYSQIEAVDLGKMFAVTNADDTGPGSLRQAISDANAHPGFDTIGFDAAFFATPRTIAFAGVILINDNVDITGPGKALLTLDGQNATRLFAIDGPGQLAVTLSGLTFANANASAIAVADEAVTVRDTAFAKNTAANADGGAIVSGANSRLFVSSSSFTDNQATGPAGDGGAIHAGGELVAAAANFAGNAAGGGGGAVFAAGPATLAGGTFHGNTSTGDGAALFLNRFAQLSQVTISGNTGDGAVTLADTYRDEFRVHNSTVVNNTGGGMLTISQAGTATIESSIVHGNTGFQIKLAMTTDIIRSLLGTGPIPAAAALDGFTADRVGVDPLLGPLADNGGPTPTHLLLAGSPAIDAGTNPDGLTADPRGVNRAQGVRLDIGAVEGVSGNRPAVVDFAFTGQFELDAVQTFTLTFADDAAMNIATLDGNDVRVTGPHGFDTAATFESVDATTDGTPRTATYSFTPPGGSWTAEDLGTYVARIQPNQIADAAGNFVISGAVGDIVPLFGQTFVVTNTADAGPGSLRQATLDANASPGADRIIFDPVVFATAQTIQLATGQLRLTEATTVVGPGKNLLAIDGQNSSRVLQTEMNYLQDVIVSGVTLKNGKVFNDEGAGINALATRLTLNDVVITGCFSDRGGPALVAETTGSVTATNCAFTGNTMNGTANLVGGAVGIFNSVSASFTACEFTDNVNTGGASFDVSGGGLGLASSGAVTLTASTVRGNSADGNGGGIHYQGGGPLTIDGSTIDANTAGVSGGGVNLAAVLNNVMIRNSTISGNKANVNGGGLRANAGTSGTFTVQNTTITANTAATGTGGGVFRGNGNLTLTSSIVAGNFNATSPDIAGNFMLIKSLVGKTDGGNPIDGGGNILGTAGNPADPLLGPLTDNGGTVRTHLPAAASPVRNAGSNPASLSTDQRGQIRTQQGFTDIGAVEISDTRPTAFVTSPVVTTAGATSHAFTVTFTDETAINVSTIATGDVTVTGPGGFTATPTLVSIDNNTNGSPRTATFTLPRS